MVQGPEHFNHKEWVHEMQGETSKIGVSDAASLRYWGRISSIYASYLIKVRFGVN